MGYKWERVGKHLPRHWYVCIKTQLIFADERNSQCASQTSDEAAFRAFTEKADAMLEADQQSRLKYGTQSILKPIKMTGR